MSSTTSEKPTNQLYVLQQTGDSVDCRRHMFQVIDDHPGDEEICGTCRGWGSPFDGMVIYWPQDPEDADAQAAAAL